MTRGLRAFLDGLGALPPAERTRAARTTATAWADELARGHFADLGTVLAPMRAARVPDVVWVDGLPFTSLCPHHLLPVHGTAYLAYRPSASLAPLGQLARLVELAAARLVLQEDLAEDVADAMEGALRPRGSACLLVGAHECMRARGPRTREASVRVLAARGCFREARWRRELMSHVGEVRR